MEDDAPESKPPSRTHVIITGIDLPFSDLVAFLVKLAFAAIPAAIIVAILCVMAMAVLSSLFRS